jgi:hypothetical protein
LSVNCRCCDIQWHASGEPRCARDIGGLFTRLAYTAPYYLTNCGWVDAASFDKRSLYFAKEVRWVDVTQFAAASANWRTDSFNDDDVGHISTLVTLARRYRKLR